MCGESEKINLDLGSMWNGKISAGCCLAADLGEGQRKDEMKRVHDESDAKERKKERNHRGPWHKKTRSELPLIRSRPIFSLAIIFFALSSLVKLLKNGLNHLDVASVAPILSNQQETASENLSRADQSRSIKTPLLIQFRPIFIFHGQRQVEAPTHLHLICIQHLGCRIDPKWPFFFWIFKKQWINYDRNPSAQQIPFLVSTNILIGSLSHVTAITVTSLGGILKNYVMSHVMLTRRDDWCSAVAAILACPRFLKRFFTNFFFWNNKMFPTIIYTPHVQFSLQNWNR